MPVLLLIALNSESASTIYPIKINKQLHDTKIYVETNKLNVTGSITILKLSNFGTETVDCKATFIPGIEQSKSFKRRLKPNTDISIRHTTARPPNRLNIDLDCRAVEEKTTDA